MAPYFFLTNSGSIHFLVRFNHVWPIIPLITLVMFDIFLKNGVETLHLTNKGCNNSVGWKYQIVVLFILKYTPYFFWDTRYCPKSVDNVDSGKDIIGLHLCKICSNFDINGIWEISKTRENKDPFMPPFQKKVTFEDDCTSSLSGIHRSPRFYRYAKFV